MAADATEILIAFELPAGQVPLEGETEAQVGASVTLQLHGVAPEFEIKQACGAGVNGPPTGPRNTMLGGLS